jgi:hypothetical protein
LSPRVNAAGNDRPQNHLQSIWSIRSASLVSGPVLPNTRLIDEQVHGRKREHLPVSRLKEPTHIFAAHLEAAAGNAGNHIIAMARLIAESA